MSKNKKAISKEGYGSGKQVKIELVGRGSPTYAAFTTADPIFLTYVHASSSALVGDPLQSH